MEDPKLHSNLNVEVGGERFEDAAEKVGSLFGEGGRLIGKIIDELTKNLTIKIETEKNIKDEKDKTK